MNRWLLPVFFVVVLAAPALPAQELGGDWRPLGQMEGAPRDDFGNQVVAGPDLDGDGLPELAVGLSGREDAQNRVVGAVQLLSARAGVIYWEYQAAYTSGSDSEPETGESLAWVPDLDGDGFPDLLSGSHWALTHQGRVIVLSGASGTFIRDHVGTTGAISLSAERLGEDLLGVPDVDGDGFGDYLISVDASDDLARGLERTGRVDCHSGATGQLLWEAFGAQEDARFGWVLESGPDLNGDGRAEVLTSSSEVPSGAASGGTVYALDVLTGQVLQSYTTPILGLADQYFGTHALAVLPDQDGDGLEEIAVSATLADTRRAPDAGYVTLLSSADGTPLWFVGGGTQDGQFGKKLYPVDDLDQDGYPDLVIYEPGPPWSADRTLHVVSGADGSRLWLLGVSSSTGFSLGSGLAAFDRTGDGLPELFAGEPAYGGGLGRILVLSFAPYLYSGTRELSAASPGELRLRLDFPSSEAGLDYGVLASASGQGPTTLGGVDVPLSADGVFQRTLQSPPPAFRGTLDAQGDGQVRVQMPSAPLTALIGTTLHFAAVSGSGAQAHLSSVAVPVDVVP